MSARRSLIVLFAASVSLVATGAPVTLDIPVTTGNDDAFEDSGGDLKLSDTKLELGKHPFAGTRFQNVTIPQGATITNAYVRFTSTSDESDDIDVDIVAENADSAGAFSGSYYLTNRTPTFASVNWTTSNWVENSVQDTPDIKSVIQAVVDRAAWSSGGNVTILFRSNDTSKQQFAWARDNGSADAPVLHIEYDTSIVRPELLFITDGSSPTLGEQEEIAQIRAWGYRVVTLEDSSSQTEYDAALATADVAFIGEEVDGGSVNYKMRTTTVGVVVAERNTYEEMGFTSILGQEHTDDSVTVVDNGHPITSGYALSDVPFVNTPSTLSVTNGTLAPGLRGLTEHSGHYGFFTLDVGDELVDSYSGNSLASGRRVGVPLASPTLSWATLTSDGLELVQRSIEWARAGDLEFEIAGHWKLDDGSGTTAVDSSGRSRDGTLVGSPAWETDGQIGGSLRLAADANDRVELPHEVLDGTDSATITAWVRPEPSSTRKAYFSGANSSNSNEILLGVSDTTVSFYDGEDDNDSSRLIWTLPYSIADRWSHLAIVRDSSANQALLYLDGQLVGAQSATLNPLNIDSGGLVVGEDQDSVGGGFQTTDSYAGSIDDLRVYSTALEAADVAQVYGLIGHWKLDETGGTTAVDSSLLSNDGTYLNGVSTNQPGPYPGNGTIAAAFDGADDQVEAPHHDAYNPDEAVSIALWVKRGDVTWWDTLVSKGKLGNPPYILAWAGTDARLTFKADLINVISTGSVTENEWTHLVVTFDEEEVRFYLNGVLDSTHSLVTELTTDSTLGLNLGAAEFDTGYSEVSMRDVRLYNRVISAKEIAELYGLIGHWRLDETAGTTATDSSLLGNDGLYRNGVTLGNDGPYPGSGGAADFDGTTNQFVQVDVANDSDYDLTEAISVASWVKVDAHTNLADCMMAKGTDTWRLSMQAVESVPRFVCDGLTPEREVVATQNIEDGAWHHVAGVYDGSELRIYIDGKLDNSVSTSGTLDTNDFRVQLAEVGNGQSQFNGLMHDARVYNRAISHAEIARLYGLVGWWRLEEGSGFVVSDSSGSGNHGEVVGVPNWSTNSREGSGSIELDGTNHVVIPTVPIQQGDAAVSGWARLTSADSRGATLINVGNALGIRLDDPLDDRGSIAFTYNGTSTFDLATTGRYQNGTGWHHFAASYDDTAMAISFYIDGILMQTVPTAGPLQIPGTADITVIGDHPLLFDSSFTGNLDDVRLYNRAISPEEVREQFFGGFVAGPRIIRWVEVANP